jgi:hypothetical protein
MMTLDNALRSGRQGREERRDPREVFREFLANLGRTACRRPDKPPKAKVVRRAGR